MHAIRDGKTEAVANIVAREIQRDIKEVLVVGCGTGVEAAILAECFGAHVTGIDVVGNFHPEASRHATLQLGDATALEFNDATFDFVYSYHSLEHINAPERALLEIKRVLTNNGWFWIGTPNRYRVVGYLGSKHATSWEKVKWNLTDWKARLLGRFKNEFGAHAGFSEKELSLMLQQVFSESKNVSSIYFNEIYYKHRKLLYILEQTRLSTIAYPSVYFMGKK